MDNTGTGIFRQTLLENFLFVLYKPNTVCTKLHLINQIQRKLHC